MEEKNYAGRKSRLVFHRADKRVSEWRAVGSVTIVAPELDTPLVLKDGSYTIIFQEAKTEGELRDAVVLLHRLQRPLWVTVIWLFSAMYIGAVLMRWWFKFH